MIYDSKFTSAITCMHFVGLNGSPESRTTNNSSSSRMAEDHFNTFPNGQIFCVGVSVRNKVPMGKDTANGVNVWSHQSLRYSWRNEHWLLVWCHLPSHHWHVSCQLWTVHMLWNTVVSVVSRIDSSKNGVWLRWMIETSLNRQVDGYFMHLSQIHDSGECRGIGVKLSSA